MVFICVNVSPYMVYLGIILVYNFLKWNDNVAIIHFHRCDIAISQQSDSTIRYCDREINEIAITHNGEHGDNPTCGHTTSHDDMVTRNDNITI